MLDYVISGGTIVDGTGADRVHRRRRASTTGASSRSAGGSPSGAAYHRRRRCGRRRPGWVDVHTHYDGQVTWDDQLEPSFGNGVTTLVMGNCGVGFAPVPPGGQATLIELMEGVEDIPGTALYEGMPWGEWETFPEYLDFLDRRALRLDIAAQLAHGALRFYVMGERGRAQRGRPADDIAAMARLVGEAVAAGAVGFSTSRTIGHRSIWGDAGAGHVRRPRRSWSAIAEAMADGRRRRVRGDPCRHRRRAGRPRRRAHHPAAGARTPGRRVARRAAGRSRSRSCSADFDPDLWREILRPHRRGQRRRARSCTRRSRRGPIGFLAGLSATTRSCAGRRTSSTWPSCRCPNELAAMRDPEVKDEHPHRDGRSAPEAPGSMENVRRRCSLARRR